MRITDVTTTLLTAPGQHIGMPNTQRSAALIRVVSDTGVVGLGESYAGLYIPQVVPHIVDLYRPLLVGADPFAINYLWDLMSMRSMRWGLVGLSIQVMAGIEMALWDLKAKALGVPAYELLGGLAQDKLRLYASAYASVWPPEKTAEKVHYFADQGFTAVKLASGFWGRDRTRDTAVSQLIEEECAKVEAIRKVVGNSVDFALDHHAANNPYPWPEDVAIQVIGALDPYGLLWFEQPCDPADVEAHARLAEAVRTPIAGAEDVTTLEEMNAIIGRRALDVIQPDVAWMGVMPTLKAMGMAEAKGVRASLHVGGTAVTRAANYHLALSVRNCFIAEHQVEKNPLFDELMVEPFRIESGYLYPPTAPGWGVELKEETVARYPLVQREWKMSRQPGGLAQGTR